ncbi:uncharacterized protein LOC117337197 isoform X2 [Pecten maximus]|nr:uncharacterized protein LOC117337197 isoform X2 [Pecten maximus]
MFVLRRRTPCRVFYHVLNVAKITNVLTPNQTSTSPASVCECNHKKCLPHVVSRELQFLRKYANSIPNYWYGMRTDEKIEYAKEMYQKILTSLPENTLVVYTDGSVLDSKGRVGPCGIGAVIYQKDKTKVAELSVPVSARASVELAEYTAIEKALSHITKNINLIDLDKIQFFCDNQEVIKGCLYDTFEAYKDIVVSIRQKRDYIVSQGVGVAIDWIPSDAGVDGNDHADQLALRAAKKAAILPLESTLITERDVQRSMKRFKSITGSKGRKRDYSENVMLAILMKEKKNQKKMEVANDNSNRNSVMPELIPMVDMNERRVLFTGMNQDDLHRSVSKAVMHGCTVDKKLSNATDFVVHGSCDATNKAEIEKLAYKLGIPYISCEAWEKALSKCSKVGLPEYTTAKVGLPEYTTAKVGLPEYTTENHKNTTWGQKSLDGSGLEKGTTEKTKRAAKVFKKR